MIHHDGDLPEERPELFKAEGNPRDPGSIHGDDGQTDIPDVIKVPLRDAWFVSGSLNI